jgi:hypothetical protein
MIDFGLGDGIFGSDLVALGPSGVIVNKLERPLGTRVLCVKKQGAIGAHPGSAKPVRVKDESRSRLVSNYRKLALILSFVFEAFVITLGVVEGFGLAASVAAAGIAGAAAAEVALRLMGRDDDKHDGSGGALSAGGDASNSPINAVHTTLRPRRVWRIRNA